jgi:hypothetical protein
MRFMTTMLISLSYRLHLRATNPRDTSRCPLPSLAHTPENGAYLNRVHAPPRAVGMPRAAKARATPRSDLTPLA